MATCTVGFWLAVYCRTLRNDFANQLILKRNFERKIISVAIVLRTNWGFAAFNYVGEQVATFLQFASEGSKFVFGPELVKTFAFGVAPIIIYMSMITRIGCYSNVLNGT